MEKANSDEEETHRQSPPPPSDTSADFVEINTSDSENRIKNLLDSSSLNESTINGDSDQTNASNTNDDEDSLTQANTNLITASTLVITTSQIIEDLNKSFGVDLADDLNESKNSDKIELKEDEEVRNSIEVINENNKEDDEEHNRTLDEFVQPSSDEQYEPTVTETTTIVTQIETLKTDDYSAGMNKSCVDLGYDNKQEEEELTNQEEEPKKSDEFKLQNTSLDDENLERDYEIPNFNSLKAAHEFTSLKQEQFVNLDTSELDSKLNGFNQDITQAEVSQPKLAVKTTKVRNLNEETYEKPLGNDTLQKRIIQYGDEETQYKQSRPQNGQMVTISYKAFIKESNEIVEDNEDLTFILGDSDVMPAIDVVVSLMDKNEICEVIAEARHAYGQIGKKLPPKTQTTNTLFIEIPANATLFLRIHLKSFTDVTDMNQMKPVERLSLAEAKKLRGNFYFNRQEFYYADTSYKKGLRYFNEENLTGEEEPTDVEKFLELRQALLMNLSLSTFKQGEYRVALNSLDQLLTAQSKHVKALFVKAKCLINLGELKEAIECLTKCHDLDKTNTDVKTELVKTQAKYKTQYENEKRMYQKMISGVSPDSKSEKKVSKAKIRNDTTSSYLSYVMAGVAVAALSIGVTMFAKYRNMF